MMDNRTFRSVCITMTHGFNEEVEKVLSMRIDIASKVLPAIVHSEACTGYHPKQSAILALDFADALIEEAMNRTEKNNHNE